MKKLNFVLVFLLVAAVAFQGIAQKPKSKAKLALTLTINTSDGNNGGGVIFNPKKNLYYIAFAGNSTYPLEVFDAKGNWKKTMETGYDVRGFWLNEKTGNIEGNSYAGAGLYYKTLDSDGYPEEYTGALLEEIDMPTEQSAGTYNSADDVIAYYYDGAIISYDPQSHTSVGTIWVSYTDINNVSAYSVFYTGVAGMEYCLFDVVKKCAVLVDKNTGKVAASVKIPVKFTPEEVFNIGYANGIFWVYTKTDRKWFGYKIF